MAIVPAAAIAPAGAGPGRGVTARCQILLALWGGGVSEGKHEREAHGRGEAGEGKRREGGEEGAKKGATYQEV